MKPSEFRKGTEHGLENSIDWPISYEDLASFYEENDRRFGISGLAGDPSHPPREARQTPPLKHGRYFKLMSEGLDRLGWHWWPADNAIISEPHRGRLACNLCGMCTSGCPRGSLGVIDDCGGPRCLRDLGHGPADVGSLAAETMRHTRVLAGSPRPLAEEDVVGILTASLDPFEAPTAA